MSETATAETTWTDEHGNEHTYGYNGTKEYNAYDGWGTRRDNPDVDCRDCGGRGTVECLGCA